MGAELRSGKLEGRFQVVGDLDVSTVTAVWRRARDLFDSSPQLSIDLSGVSKSDSAGLALLIDWTRHARAAHQEIRFENIPDQMLAIARVSGLDNVLPFFRVAVDNAGGADPVDR